MKAYSDSQQLAVDAIGRKHTRGIPSFSVNIMDTGLIDELACAAPGTYIREPEETYIKSQRHAGINCLDQFTPENPLSMTGTGYGAKS